MIISENYWFLDVEASSLNKKSYPIEIGFINAANTNSYSYLINPDSVSGWDDWSYESEDVHKISRYFLWEHGSDASFVSEELQKILESSVVIVDSPMYDKMWLYELFSQTNKTINFEIISVAEFLYDHNLYHKLVDFNKRRTELHNLGEIKHAALDDAIQNKNILIDLLA